MKNNIKLLLLFSVCTILQVFSSCVNEWPNPEDRDYPTYLKVYTVKEWLFDSEFYYDDIYDVRIQYLIQIYQKGNYDSPVMEFTHYSTNSDYPEFSIDMDLPIGEYDLYAWASLCKPETQTPFFYDIESFNDISITLPYTGNTDLKDAFCGHSEFEIKNSMELQPVVEVPIMLSRPLARYEIIATDLREFIENGKTEELPNIPNPQGELKSDGRLDLSGYTVKIYYTGYLPAVFDVFANNPIDSYTDLSYEGKITTLSDSEALLSFDYVFVNGEESSVAVALEIFDPRGERVSFVNNIKIPTQRNFNTVVTGKFLTTLEEGGIDINNKFDGQYNIEYN